MTDAVVTVFIWTGFLCWFGLAVLLVALLAEKLAWRRLR